MMRKKKDFCFLFRWVTKRDSILTLINIVFLSHIISRMDHKKIESYESKYYTFVLSFITNMEKEYRRKGLFLRTII